MKLSAALIAIATASPMGNMGGRGSGRGSARGSPGRDGPKLTTPDSGSPGKSPKTGKFATHSGKPSKYSPKPHSGHFDMEMKEEYKEFADMMYGKGGNVNSLNINFAPVNTNMQNFIDINTEIETDINVNSNGKGGKEGNYRPKTGRPHSGEYDRPRPHSGEHHESSGWKENLMSLLSMMEHMSEEDIKEWIVQWWSYIEPMLHDPDQLCPMFNMIIDESWGIGSGADWEAGCRRDMERDAEFEQLFMMSWKWDNQVFAQKFCQMMGENIMEDMSIYGGEEYHGYVIHAEPMCNCIVRNVKDTVEGNWSRPNFMSCAGTIADYAEGVMTHHGMIDHQIQGDFSEENIVRVREEIRDSFEDIEFNDDQVRLMELWDQDGGWKRDGILDGDRDMKLWAMATSVIFIEANNLEEVFPGMTAAETLVNMFENADLWIQFYETNIDWAALSSDMGDWNMNDIIETFKSYGYQAWHDILGDPMEIKKWIREHLPEPEDGDFIKKVNFFAQRDDDMFRDIYEAAYNGDDIAACVNLQQFYNDNILNRDEPVLPHKMMGMAMCLEMETVQKWIDQNVEEEIIRDEIKSMFMNHNSQFMTCMEPIMMGH